MNVFLSGGAGFIGSHIADHLVARGHEVHVLDLHACARIDEGDVRDMDDVLRAAAGCDTFIHLASLAGVDRVRANPVETMEVAMLGTMNVLGAAYANLRMCAKPMGSVGRFIDFSTSEVFGQYAFRVTEADATALGAVGEARWTYAVAKLATEHLCMAYHRQFGFPAVAVRPFNVYGPGQVGEGAVHRFIVNALRGVPLDVHNDGSQIRSWCFVSDIVDAVMLMLERPEAVGHSFNIGNPRSTLTIYDLARTIVRLTGSKSEIRFVDWPHADVELRVPSIEQARALLGYQPKVDLEDGLARTIEWYRGRT